MTYEKRDMVFHAIDHYEKAIQVNPEFYDAITALANLYQKQEFWRKAVEMWELALLRDQGRGGPRPHQGPPAEPAVAVSEAGFTPAQRAGGAGGAC